MNIESSTLFRRHLEHWAENITKLTVKMQTLDEVIEQLDLDRIDIAKIDVEGAEEKVIKGAEHALTSGLIKKLVVEAHEEVIPLKRTINLLKEHNYRVDHVLLHPRVVVQSFIFARWIGGRREHHDP